MSSRVPTTLLPVRALAADRTRIASGLPRHDVRSAHARQAHPRARRRRSPGRPRCLPAGRRDRAAGRRHASSATSSCPGNLGTDWIYVRSSAPCPSPSPRHSRLSLARAPDAQDRQPQPGAGHPNRRRRPPLPVRRDRSHREGRHHEHGALLGQQRRLPESEGGQTSPGQVPTDIIFDRCYVHGTPTGGVRRGIAMNGCRMAVVDSYLSDFHEVGADSQAISGWNGPGPFKVVSNYLEGAGENLMFGGADPSIPDLVPSDIEIRGNHLFKPLSWKIGHPSYAGRPWSVKNIFELKNARRGARRGQRPRIQLAARPEWVRHPLHRPEPGRWSAVVRGRGRDVPEERPSVTPGAGSTSSPRTTISPAGRPGAS